MNRLRQVVAIIGIVLLVGLYVASLAAAIFDDPHTFTLLKFAVTGTIVIPAFLWIIGMFLRLAKGEGQINFNPDEDDASDDSSDVKDIK